MNAKCVQGGGGSARGHDVGTGPGGGIPCQVKFVVGNFADPPRNVVVRRALRARWSLAPGFRTGNVAARSNREVSHTKPTSNPPPPPLYVHLAMREQHVERVPIPPFHDNYPN